jgi:hypothetical protein
MRALSCIIALAFVLTGPSLAVSTDRDMPGVGTFTYCGIAGRNDRTWHGGCDQPVNQCRQAIGRGEPPVWRLLSEFSHI